MDRIKEFQQKTGYAFQNEGLLRQALTHSSYANEHHMKKCSDNERLEFLGDAVLEIISSEFLYFRYGESPEGELTKLRASMVCEQSLAFCCRKIRLGNYLLLGKGEELTGGRERNSILSDAFEAVIGAVYLDGGFEAAKKFVYRHVLEDMDRSQLFYDSKTKLQELVQAENKGALSYRLIAETGPDHNKKFVVEAWIGERPVSRGEGHTKKAAEQEAAYQAILKRKEKAEQENSGNDT